MFSFYLGGIYQVKNPLPQRRTKFVMNCTFEQCSESAIFVPHQIRDGMTVRGTWRSFSMILPQPSGTSRQCQTLPITKPYRRKPNQSLFTHFRYESFDELAHSMFVLGAKSLFALFFVIYLINRNAVCNCISECQKILLERLGIVFFQNRHSTP